jgi:hypothetical protein
MLVLAVRWRTLCEPRFAGDWTMAELQTKALANHLWRERGCPTGDTEADWWSAECLLTRLRPYLSVRAALDRENLIAEIEDSLTNSSFTGRDMVTVIAVLDGAREYGEARCREAKAASPNNGVHPEKTIERKDAEFYRGCHDVLLLYGARILEKNGESGAGRELDVGHPVSRGRWFQDACIGLFASGSRPKDNICTTIAASIHLCRSLKRINEEQNHPWLEQLHARIAIGFGTEAAIACLPCAWRDEIAVDPRIWNDLPENVVELLFAAGGRIGAGSPDA